MSESEHGHGEPCCSCCYEVARLREQVTRLRGLDLHERYCSVNDPLGSTACDCAVRAALDGSS